MSVPIDTVRKDASAIVRFEDVSLHFGDVVALDRVSFRLSAGETCMVYGAAGSGKTMLLKVAVGLVKPDSGRVYLMGQEITRLEENALFDLRANVGILFQEGALFDSLNIEENVAYPLVNQRVLQQAGANGSRASNGGPGRRIEDRVREALRFVELEQTLAKFPSELSGGMRRRVGIARAIVTEPQLVLYDSPTAGLDPITANTIIALILKERDLRNAAAIMVTHRYQDGHLMANFRYNPNSEKIEPLPPEDRARASTRFFVMNQGRLVFEGSEAQFETAQDPYVRKFLRPTGG
jgi:phospholipid/cholesterol/gamma-HCH transport system ATP-binding protein